jgi:hypothetical protein
MKEPQMLKRTLIPLTTIVALALAVSGCQADAGTAGGTASPSAPAAAHPSASPSAPTADHPAAPKGGASGESAPAPSDNAKGIINDTTMQSCSVEPGRVTAVGSVTAPVAGDATVTVSWTDSATSAILAKQFASIEGLKAGETRTWKIEVDLAQTDADVRCVLGATLEPV